MQGLRVASDSPYPCCSKCKQLTCQDSHGLQTTFYVSSVLDARMPNIGELSLYDVVGTPGVAADVSHMDSKPNVSRKCLACTKVLYLVAFCAWFLSPFKSAVTLQVTSHLGPEQLSSALYNSHLVIIPAGVPRKPGMTRDDLFNINAGISAATVLASVLPAR